MKKYLSKFKKNNFSVIGLINRIIENDKFKPISISIVICYVFFHGYNFISVILDDYHDRKKFSDPKPITINISNPDLKFNFQEDQTFEYKFKKGDTLLKILLNLGVSENDSFSILKEIKKIYSARSISEGTKIIINYKAIFKSESSEIIDSKGLNKIILVNSISLKTSIDEKIEITRNIDNSYSSKEIKIKLNRSISRYYGSLKTSFFVDGVKAGISPNSMMNMIKLYSYDVDFQRDIKKGDKFEMLVESFYDQNNKKVKDGDVLFSSLMLKNQKIDFYLHRINGKVEYFDEKGNSIRKSLLKTPINGARVSSGFGFRKHPILGYSKLHKGVDFAASTGTPILAAGSGKIVYYSRYGGYGNYVKIKHNSEYSTAYAHASRFVKKLRVGSSVKQGDVIAYVGTTGRSTGPHLHFEVIYKGKAINPSKVKATSGLRLTGRELTNFKITKSNIDNFRKNIPNLIK